MNIFTDILNKILKPSITAASTPARFNKTQTTVERAVNILRAAGVTEDSEFANRVDKVVAALNAYAKIDGANKTKKEAKPAAEKKPRAEKSPAKKTVKKEETAVTKPEIKVSEPKKTKSSPGKVKAVKVPAKKPVKTSKTVVKLAEVTPITAPTTTPSK